MTLSTRAVLLLLDEFSSPLDCCLANTCVAFGVEEVRGLNEYFSGKTQMLCLIV